MNVKEFANNCLDKLQEASPRVKIVVGVTGLIGAGIAACVSSSKVKEELKPERKAIKDIKKIRNAQAADTKGIELPEEALEEVSGGVWDGMRLWSTMRTRAPIWYAAAEAPAFSATRRPGAEITIPAGNR